MKKILMLMLLSIIILIGIVSTGTWSSTEDDGAWAYYSLNESSGDYLDLFQNTTGDEFVFTDSVSRGIQDPTIHNGAVNFTKSGDHLNITGSPLNYPQDITNMSFNLWIYDNDFGVGGVYISDCGTAVDENWLGKDGTQIQFIISGTTLDIVGLPTSGEWHMFTGTYDGSEISLYIDGVLNATASATGAINAGGGQNIMLGNACASATSNAKAFLDEFTFWSKNLTSSAISNLYDSGTGTFKNSVGLQAETTLDVSLISPTNGQIFTTSNFTFNATATTTNLNLTNATTHVWFSNGTIFNQTTTSLTGNVTNSTNFNLQNITFGDYIWNSDICAINATSSTTCAFAGSNFTFERQTFSVDAELFPSLVHETENSTFEINITIDASQSFFSASLIYNGTGFLFDEAEDLGSGQFFIKKTIDVPLVAENATKNFFWQFTFGDGSFVVQNSTTNTQNISNTNITSSGTDLTINYTIYDEETLELIDTEFKATFDWFLGGGTITENASFDLTRANTFLFYQDPNNKTLYTDTTLELTEANITSANTSSYNDKTFDFNFERFNTTIIDRQLFMLPEGNGTNIIIDVKDEGLSPLEGIYVTINRYYPGENTFRMVENRRTDGFGQFASRLVEDRVRYKFEFRNKNNTLLKEEDLLTISCRTTICILPFVIQDLTDDFARFGDIDGFSHTLTFNNETNIFSLTWNDNTGNDPTIRLEVTRFLFNGTTTVCNPSQTSNIGSLTCDVGSQRASYQAQAFRRVGTNEIRFDVLSVKVGDLSTIFGLEGLMWSFVLLFTMMIAGMYSPPVGVVLYLVGFILLGVLGIVFIHPAILIANIVIGVLFIWAFRS